MATFIILGTLAAFGLLCALWALIGWMLPGGRGGCIVCLCRPDARELSFLGRVQILRKLGIWTAPVVLMDDGVSEETRQWMEHNGIVSVRSPGELLRILELERDLLE